MGSARGSVCLCLAAAAAAAAQMELQRSHHEKHTRFQKNRLLPMLQNKGLLGGKLVFSCAES